MMRSAAAAVTSSASWDWAPEEPVDRRLRGTAPGGHRAQQRASHIAEPGGEQLAIGGDRRLAGPWRTTAPTAAVSVKLMSTMPSAPGQMGRAARNPAARTRVTRWGTSPINATPRVSRPSTPAAIMPAAMAMSGAGSLGTKRLRPTRSRIVPTAIREHEQGGLRERLSGGRRLCRNEPFTIRTPSSLGIWSSTMTTRCRP